MNTRRGEKTVEFARKKGKEGKGGGSLGLEFPGGDRRGGSVTTILWSCEFWCRERVCVDGQKGGELGAHSQQDKRGGYY